MSEQPVNVVWMYWESPSGSGRRPPYLDLCLETIRHQSSGLQVRLLDQVTVRDWLPNLRPDLDGLPSIAAKSDYIRAALLAEYGGFWLDIDTIALSPLLRLTTMLDDHQLVTGPGCGVSVVGARPGCEAVARWLSQIDVNLDNRAESLRVWSGLGSLALRSVVLSDKVEHYDLAKVCISPVGWREWPRFLSPVANVERLFEADPYVITLYNEVMGPALAKLERSYLLRSRRLVSRLFRVGLGLSEPSAEKFWGDSFEGLAATSRKVSARFPAVRRLSRLSPSAQPHEPGSGTSNSRPPP